MASEIKTYSRHRTLRIAQREGFACGGNDAASVCGGNDAAAKSAGDATAVVVIQHNCSNMQSLLCTALDAIELKRMKWGNQRTENGGLVRGGDSWENLGLAEVGEWVWEWSSERKLEGGHKVDRNWAELGIHTIQRQPGYMQGRRFRQCWRCRAISESSSRYLWFLQPISPDTLADSFEVEFVVVWYAFAFAFLIYIFEPVSGLSSANFLGTTLFTYHTRVFPLLISRASIDTVLLDQRPNTRYLWISIPIVLEIKISFGVQLMPLHSCG